jgi:hypothetical protein
MKGATTVAGVWRKGLVRSLVMAVESGLDFPGSGALPDSVKGLVKKYRELYVRKGLTDKFGFAINDIKKPKTRQLKFLRVLEIYWEIERDADALTARAPVDGATVTVLDAGDDADADDLDDLEEDEEVDGEELGGEASASTAPSKKAPSDPKVWRRRRHSLLSVSKMLQRYARVDSEVWRTHLYKRLTALGVTDLDKHDMTSMFNEGGGYRVDVRTLRSKRKGYRFGMSVTCNGNGLVTSYANARKVASSGSLLRDYVPDARDRVIGADPGRVNILTCCVTMERAGVADPTAANVGLDRQAASFATLTRNRYYADSGIDAVRVKTERRKLTHSREAHEELSQTRKKTVVSAEFIQYVRCVGRHWPAFDATYNSRNALGDKFSLYEGKLRTKDRFISSFGSHEDVAGEGRLVIAMGDAKFSSTGPGERAVPTTALQKRMVTAHRASFDTVGVGEHNTTKACCECHELTSECHRWRVVKGVGKWVKDRDVRRCNSPQCLESPHPCAAEPRLLTGLREWEAGEGGVYIDRDRNPSLMMARLCGLENAMRPAIFQGRGQAPDNNVPPLGG